MAVSFSVSSFTYENPGIYSVLSDTYSPDYLMQVYSFDLNRDGNSDLILLGAAYLWGANPVPQPGLVAFGVGDGIFELASESVFPVSALLSTHPRELVHADFNGDGFEDFYIADHGLDLDPFPGAQNQLFLSNGDGTWRDATGSLPAVSDFSHSAAAGDIDGDGSIDLIVGNVPYPNPVYPYVLLNDGAGNFSLHDDLLPTAPGEYLHPDVTRITSVGLADLDGDGHVDMIAGAGFSSESYPRTSAILWNDSGSFANEQMTELPMPASFGANHNVYDIQAIDVNFDGRPDLVVSYQRDAVYGGWELQILENQGDRVFIDKTTTYLPNPADRTGGDPKLGNELNPYLAGAWIQFIVPADVNADGRMDFVLDSRGFGFEAPDKMPYVYVHQADGSFEVITAGELSGGNPWEGGDPDGQPWLYDFATRWAVWDGGTGFVHVDMSQGFYFDADDAVLAFTQEVDISPILPIWYGGVTESVVRVGTNAADSLYGGMNDDLLTGRGGNDLLDGGGGFDLARFGSALGLNSIERVANGDVVVSGPEGTDTLQHIEALEFSDFTVNLGVQEAAQQLPAAEVDRLIELYVAFFNRVPDANGLQYWMGKYQSGMALDEIAESFYAAGVQYSELTGFSAGMTNGDFVDVIYRNVLGREDGADAEALAYWSGKLGDGSESRGSLVSTILDSAHTFKGNATWGWVADLLDNKVAVSQQFAIDWGLNYNTPEDSIAQGMAIAAAILPEDFLAAIDLIGVEPGQIELG